MNFHATEIAAWGEGLGLNDEGTPSDNRGAPRGRRALVGVGFPVVVHPSRLIGACSLL
jgi:hypothetical protein